MRAPVPTWPVILWDYDGTIVDSVPAIVAAHHLATERVLGIRIDEDAIRDLIGEPAHQRITTLVPHRTEEVYSIYSESMASLSPDATPVFAGLIDILQGVNDAGARNALVTSRPRAHVLAALEYFKVANQFSSVVCLEDTPLHKPHPEPLLRALASLEAFPPESVYIGDAVVDVEAAHAAALDSVAVTWGAGRPDALEAERPTRLVNTPIELADTLGLTLLVAE